MTKTLTAQDVFRSAYENRYTWDKDFPGYQAQVTMKTADSEYTAQAKVNSDLSFEVSGIEDKSEFTLACAVYSDLSFEVSGIEDGEAKKAYFFR